MIDLNSNTRKNRLRTSQTGVSLIEVLVAMLLIAFGMAAMAGMLVFSVKANTNSSNRSIATMLAVDYAEQIRANPNEMAQPTPAYARSDSTAYDKLYTEDGRTLPTSSMCTYPACTSADLATGEKSLFLRRLKLALPSGDFVLNKVSNTQADIWILWTESQGVGNNQANETNIDACPTVVTDLGASKLPRCLYMRISL
jgi:type IV pilus assembly protein PilV